MKPSDVSANDTVGAPKDPDRFFRTDHVSHDLKDRTIRGGAVTIGAEAIKQLLWIVSTVVLARALTPADNGLVAMVIVITAFIGQFNDLGLSTATIQRAEINQQQVSTLFWVNVALGIGLALLCVVLAPVISWVYNEPRLFWITLVISISFIFSGLGVQHRALLRRQMHFNVLAVIDVAATTFETLVGIAAALAGWGYWALVLQRLAAAPVSLLAIWIMCPWRPGKPSRAEGVRSMLGVGGNLTGFSLATYIARNVDNLLIGKFYGAAQLGYYSKAYNLLLVPLQRISGPIASVAVTVLSRLIDSPERYRQAYFSIAAKIGLLTMPLVAFMIGASDWLVLIVLGEKWMATSQIFALLGISGLVEPFSATILWLFISQERTRQQFHWGLISSAGIVVAILAGLPWGAIGVAASYSAVSICLRVPFLFWFAGREGPVRTRDLYRTLAPFASAVCTTLLSIFVFRQWVGDVNPFIGVLAAIVITAVTTLLTLAILPSGRHTIRELKTIPGVLLKRKAIA